MSQIVTFYSYKGGVGRTFLLANVAVLLAKWGLRVLCIDWDLEAPGLPHYFRRITRTRRSSRGGSEVGSRLRDFETVETPPARGGVVDVMASVANTEQVPWRSMVLEIAGDGWKLDLLAAGSPGPDYVASLRRLDWTRLYEEHDLGWYLEDLRNQWLKDYDLVLVDSRTGLTDIGGICAAQLPDILVVLSSANLQSLEGCLDVIERAKRARDRLPIPRPAPLVLPLVSRFDDREEYDDADEWLDRFAEAWQPFYRVWAPADTEPRTLLASLRIPYISKWSFGERLPVLRERIDDPGLISWFIANVAACLVQGLGNTGSLVANRNAYIRQATPSLAGRRSYDVFISYNNTTEDLAAELYEQLKKRSMDVFFARSEIQPGDLLIPTLEQAISSSRVVVVIIGPDFDPSWQDQEVTIALSNHHRGKTRIVPIYVSGQTPAMVPPRISQFHGLITDGPMDKVANELALLVEKERSDPGL